MLPNLEQSQKVLKENETVIECCSCRNNLWVISRSNVPAGVSTQTLPVYPNTIPFSIDVGNCPICGSAWKMTAVGYNIVQTNRGEVEVPI